MSLTSISLLLVAAIAGVALIEVVIRRSDVGAALVMILLVVQESSFTDLGWQGGPVNVYPNDLLFLVLMTSAIARLLRTDRTSAAQKLLIGFGVALAWSLLRGADVSGLPAAMNEGRKYLGFLASALYFSTVEPRRDLFEQIGRIWLWAAAAICALTLFRWGANAAGMVGGIFGEGGTLRVVPAAAAMVVGQAALIGVPTLRDRESGLLRFITPTLLAFVVLLQHRTVWLVVAAGLTYLLFRERALTARFMTTILAGLLVIAALSIAVLDDPEDPVSDQLTTSATSTGTFEWRVDGWRALLRESAPETIEEMALGLPFGGGYARNLDGQVVDVSPHSFYIETYLRLGLVGLSAVLALYVLILRWSVKSILGRSDVGLLSRNVLVTIVGVQLLYYVTYSPNQAQAMLLGLGCAAISFRGSSQLASDPVSVETSS